MSNTFVGLISGTSMDGVDAALVDFQDDGPPLLLARHGEHDAEHLIMECLGKAIWEAQRAQREPDEQQYLECVRSLPS